MPTASPASRRLAALALTAVLCGAFTTAPAPAHAGVPQGAPAPAPASARDAGLRAFHAWTTAADWALGRGRFVATEGDDLVLATPAKRSRGRVDGLRFDTGTWRSPWQPTEGDFTELIASWQARTGRVGWVLVEVRGRGADGARSSWDTVARWTQGNGRVRRTTFDAQPDDAGAMDVDTWRTSGQVAYQMRVTLARKRGTSTPVRLSMLGAAASRIPAGPTATSTPGPAVGAVLEVPGYSQMLHRGHFPQFGGGGRAWCSPASTAMVLGYYGALPTPGPWLAGHADAVVDDTARRVYDVGYAGAGTWPFNTAYAASRPGIEAFVTRLPDLTAIEPLIAAGIPVVTSVAFGRGQLPGAPIAASAGHLMVVVGFTATGDVVVNDPAAPDNSSVRRTYARAPFERAWLGGSRGTVYVIHDQAHPLPPTTGLW